MTARRIGGVEIHTRELATRLGQRGWHVILCYLQEPTPDVREYLSLPNVSFDVIPDAAGNSWRASRDLLRIVRHHKPTVLHLQFTPFLSLHPWLARLNGAGRVLLTDHTSRSEGYVAERAPAWKRAAGRLLNAPVSFAVEVSDFNRVIIARLGMFPPGRLRTIYNAVDLRKRDNTAAASGGAFRERLQIPRDRILVTQVSQITPEKGIPDVLNAARLALRECPDLHFAFVGDGKYSDEYGRLAADLGIAERVTWTGLVTDTMEEGVFAASDISCQCSRWQEAFGLSIAEAMAFGKPVIATRTGGIPEVVEDGKTGFLVPCRDPSALAEKLVLLAGDPGLRLQMGEAGKARVATRFELCANVGALVELYGDV
jgi:glycosyltransferase involved in cell wall biosynthesis